MQKKVAVIGGGAAGIKSAWHLMKKGYEYTLIEADNQLGGRIRSHDGLGEKPVELGAEFIHGNNSEFYDLACKYHGNPVDLTVVEHGKIWIDQQLITYSEAQKDPYVQIIKEFFRFIKDYDGDDISLQQFVEEQPDKFPSRSKNILEAFIANPYGTSSDQLGMKGLALEESLWHSGDQNFVIRGNTIYNIFYEAFIKELDNNRIMLNSPVKIIDYSGDQVRLKMTNDSEYFFDHVIITLPLTILKSRDIVFYPELPNQKRQAIEKIGMGAGMKVILKFSEPLWEKGYHSLAGAQLVPIYWTPTGDPSLITGFIMGSRAEDLSILSQEQVIELVLNELNEILGDEVASKLYQNVFIQDWYKMPFIKGAYSFPKPGTAGYRKILAQPLQNKLFFAGEATHTNGHSATIHGALETADRVVEELNGL